MTGGPDGCVTPLAEISNSRVWYTKLRKEVYILEIWQPEFPRNTVWDRSKEAMGGPRPSCWDGPSILFRVRSEAQRAESGRLVLGRVSGQSKGIETQGHCVPPSFIFSLNICLVLILPCRECLPRFSRVLDYLSRQQRAIAVCLAVKVESTVQYTEIGGHAFHRCTAQLLHVQGCSQVEERERFFIYQIAVS